MTLLILIILASIVNFLDYWTTLIAINKYGLKEANPLMRKLMKYPNAFFLVKVILVTHVIMWSQQLTVIIVLVIFGLCVINNLIKILRAKRRLK